MSIKKQHNLLPFLKKTNIHRCADYKLLRAHIYLEHGDQEKGKKKGEAEQVERQDVNKVSNGKASSNGTENAGPSLWCEACKVSSTSYRNHEEHLKGAKHAKKVGDTGGHACEPCNLRFPHRQALLGHQEGKQHRKRLRAEQLKEDSRKRKAPDLDHGSPSPGPSAKRGPSTPNGNARNSFADRQSFGFPSPGVFSHPSEAFRQRLCPDPDAFRPVANMLCCPIDLQFALQGAGKYSRLTEDMVELFNCRQQRLATMNQKIALWSEIYRAVRTDIDASLFVFGSTFNGFGAEGCDIDMCLFPQVSKQSIG